MTCKIPKKLEIELYHSSELKGRARTEFHSHLKGCSCCQEYLEVLEREKTNFLFRHSYQTLNSGEDATARGLPKIWKPALVPVVLLLISLGIYLPQLFQQEFESSGQDTIIYKGKTRIELVLKRSGQVTDWKESDVYEQGDELQVIYQLTNPRLTHVQLVSIDAAGVFSDYSKTDDGASLSWQARPGSKQSLPVSFTLDESPGFEIITVLFADKPLPVTLLSQELKQMYAESAGKGEELAKMVELKFPGKSVLARTILIPKK